MIFQHDSRLWIGSPSSIAKTLTVPIGRSPSVGELPDWEALREAGHVPRLADLNSPMKRREPECHFVIDLEQVIARIDVDPPRPPKETAGAGQVDEHRELQLVTTLVENARWVKRR